jgi:hypothetical protein
MPAAVGFIAGEAGGDLHAQRLRAGHRETAPDQPHRAPVVTATLILEARRLGGIEGVGAAADGTVDRPQRAGAGGEIVSRLPVHQFAQGTVAGIETKPHAPIGQLHDLRGRQRGQDRQPDQQPDCGARRRRGEDSSSDGETGSREAAGGNGTQVHAA